MTSGVRRQWTPDEDALMLAWRADRKTLREIAAHLESNHASIGDRIKILNARAAAAAGQPLPTTSSPKQALPPPPPHPSKPGRRTCLSCGRSFASTHAGNRICYGCKCAQERRGSAGIFASR